MCRIPWNDGITNRDVLQGIDKGGEISNTVQRRKFEHLGHVMRGPKCTLIM